MNRTLLIVGIIGALALSALIFSIVSSTGIVNWTLPTGQKIDIANLPVLNDTTVSGSYSRQWLNVMDYGAQGNGVDDDTDAIKQALLNSQTSPTPGVISVIYFPPGRYLISSTLMLPSYVRLYGAGGSVLCTSADTQVNYMMELKGQDHIHLEGLVFDCKNLKGTGTSPGVKAAALIGNVSADVSHFSIQGCEFYGALTAESFPIQSPPPPLICAFVLNRVVGTVEGCRAEGFSSDTFNINSSNVVFTGNYVGWGGDGAFAVNNGGRATITGNHVIGCSLGVGSGPIAVSGQPTAQYGTHLTVTGNTFEFCDYGVCMGWFGYAGLTGPHNFTISGNTFLYCNHVGIQHEEAAADTVMLGSITGNTFTGLGHPRYSGATNWMRGISLIGVAGIQISGNLIGEPYPGADVNAIYLERCSEISVGHNHVRGSPDQFASTGVALISTHHLQIHDNWIERARNGIHMNGSLATSRIMTSIQNNKLTRLNDNGIVCLMSGEQLEISGNQFSEPFTDGASFTGIVIGPDLNQFIIRNNHMTDSTSPVVIQSTDSSTDSRSYIITQNVVDKGFPVTYTSKNVSQTNSNYGW